MNYRYVSAMAVLKHLIENEDNQCGILNLIVATTLIVCIII